eukprot:3557187-Pyramimonas_sp.AAC.1
MHQQWIADNMAQTVFSAAVAAAHLGWASVSGPAGAVVQTLRRLGWTVVDYAHWRDTQGLH